MFTDLIWKSSGVVRQHELWRGKVLFILDDNIYSMELPSLKVSSIHYQSGNLMMGNNELTIINELITIRNTNKVKFFKGNIPEGEWFIDHAQVY